MVHRPKENLSSRVGIPVMMVSFQPGDDLLCFQTYQAMVVLHQPTEALALSAHVRVGTCRSSPSPRNATLPPSARQTSCGATISPRSSVSFTRVDRSRVQS